MCNRYHSPDEGYIQQYWRLNPRQLGLGARDVFPRSPGGFIRRAVDDPGYGKELAVGRWGLIPWFSKTPDIKYSTNNARAEEVADKASFKDPWKRGQRCIIPAATFDEPCWGPYEAQFEKCEWWRFKRADGDPWGLAGLWNIWTDRATGEVHESYTMLTLNADGHEIMGKMHKNEINPDTKKPLPIDQQDKRSVIPIELADVDQWLEGSIKDAQALLKLAPVEVFAAGPA
ncbi:SOS response-associated peptidase [Comamonas sp. MYb396]|uniref:SOS response-associated peptidase n=1 Tax=Comamonas sp. MYb396 TaxID=2745302 RepID=UPI0030A6BB24